MKNKVLLFIFLFSSSMYGIETHTWRWNFFLPKIVRGARLNINSYTKLKAATFLYLGIRIGDWTHADCTTWSNRCDWFFGRATLASAALQRGIAHTKDNLKNCATFRDSWKYMMAQQREYDRGRLFEFRSTKRKGPR